MSYDKYLFDFDGTLWARNADDKLLSIAEQNIKLLNDKLGDKAVVISGNTYASIRKKLTTVFTNLNEIKFDIWADASSTLYRKDTKIDIVKETIIETEADKIVKYLHTRYNITAEKIGYPETTNVKIKPLSDLERTLLVDILNNIVFKELNITTCKAYKTGTTTVDILRTEDNKCSVFNYAKYNELKTIYIGDEIDSGNDMFIASLATDCIHVTNTQDTLGILKLL